MAGMAELPPASVNLILTDPPYGSTAAHWDIAVDWAVWWGLARRALKPSGWVLVFAAGRFLPQLLASNSREFRHDLVWVKDRPTGHLNAYRQPMRQHEHILVFSANPAAATFTPLYQAGESYIPQARPASTSRLYGQGYALREREEREYRFGSSVLYHARPPASPDRHPTEKPVALLRDLLEMYSRPDDLVLDPFAGRASTLVAALQMGRRAIGFELDSQFYAQAQERLSQEEARVPTTKLPDLEDLIRMDEHPQIGRVELIEEMTAQEFLRMSMKIPRQEWRWHDRSADELGGLFSVPLKWRMEGSVRVPTGSRERAYWNIERYTEGGQPWIRLVRQEAPAQEEALLTPNEPQGKPQNLWLRHETSAGREG